MSLLKESYPKAKKTHRCEWCGKALDEAIQEVQAIELTIQLVEEEK